MADGSEVRKRRALELNERDEVLDNTPKYADAETMAQRRIIRVKHAPISDNVPSLKGAFKAVAGTLPTGAPSLSTKFVLSGSSSTSGGATGPFSPAGEAASGAKSLPAGVDGGPSGSSSSNTNNNGGSGGVVAAGCDAGTRTSLFGEAFRFDGAKNAFVGAKERMARAAAGLEEEAPAQETHSTSDVLSHAAPVTPVTEEVLACVPCKLFVFKSETKSWVECGAGDAKVKRHDSPTSEDGEKREKRLYRLIVRDGYALNAPLCSNFRLTKAEDTHVIFAMPKNDGVATYLVKYTGQQAVGRGADFTRTLKEALRLAQEDSS